MTSAWRRGWVAAVLAMAALPAPPARGEPPWDGFYRGSPDAGAAGKDLGERIELRVEEALLVAEDNDNTAFVLRLRVPYDAALSQPGTLRLVASGRVHASSGAGASGTTWSHPSFALRGRDDADAVAKLLGIAPRLRRHPGHGLRLAFVPEAAKVPVWEPPRITFRMTNVGDAPVAFVKGGRNRAPRDNQYDFVARRAGRAVPDVGASLHFGGISVRRTLAPQETFEETVDLGKWFAFDAPGHYEIVGTYALTFLDPARDDYVPLWEDFVAAGFAIDVTATGAASPSRGRGVPDAEGAVVGEWTPVVGGLRARLVTALDDVDRGGRFVSVYVEIENVHHYASDIAIGADRVVEIDLLDDAMKPVAPATPTRFSGPVVPPVPIVLPNHSRMRAKVSSGGCCFGSGGVVVCLVDKAWFIPDTDSRAFYVRGVLQRDARDGWSGRLELPATPLDRQRDG